MRPSPRTSSASGASSRSSTPHSPRSTRCTASATAGTPEPRMRLTLRAKLALVALVLAVIPLVGYVHVKQMEALLRDGQEQALLATARAIATALHDRPQLLELRAGQPASGEMELILKSLGRAESRIWIVDQHQRLLALVGDLRKTAPQDAPDIATRLLRPIASLVLERP